MIMFLSVLCVYLLGFLCMVKIYDYVTIEEIQDIEGNKLEFNRTTRVICGVIWPISLLMVIIDFIKSWFK